MVHLQLVQMWIDLCQDYDYVISTLFQMFEYFVEIVLHHMFLRRV
jgi:predicted transcriptional regulator YheO